MKLNNRYRTTMPMISLRKPICKMRHSAPIFRSRKRIRRNWKISIMFLWKQNSLATARKQTIRQEFFGQTRKLTYMKSLKVPMLLPMMISFYRLAMRMPIIFPLATAFKSREKTFISLDFSCVRIICTCWKT